MNDLLIEIEVNTNDDGQGEERELEWGDFISFSGSIYFSLSTQVVDFTNHGPEYQDSHVTICKPPPEC